VDANDALDEWGYLHSDWESTSRAPFAARLSLALEDLRAALTPHPDTEAPTHV
jgi:hypothetical protein